MEMEEYDEFMKNEEEEDEEVDPSVTQSLPLIQQPQTPNEPIDFLSRAWSLSSSEVTKALSTKPKLLSDDNINKPPPPTTPPLLHIDPPPPPPNHVNNSWDHGWKSGSAFGRWFLHRDSMASPKSKKDTIRIQNAHAHASLSVAGLAAALAAAAAAAAGKGKNFNGGSKMGQAMASAAELLASHCIELAESAGVAPDRISSVVQSAVDIRSAGDLMTLTAAAATALRGEAVFRGRLPKETNKRNPSPPLSHNNNNHHHQPVPPPEPHSFEEVVEPCTGELLHQTRKGCYRRKNVSVYINKQSEVTVMVVRKHVGGAFSMKSKFVVCGICDEAKTRRGEGEDYSFGLQTCKGYLEFKCESKGEKQWWIDGVENLLRRAACTESDLQSVHFTTDSEDA